MISRKPEHVRPRNQNGATLAYVALFLFVLLGVAALAVDLGRLMSARTQAQRTADAAAMAGAAAFPVGLPEDQTDAQAREWAEEFGEANLVMGKQPDIRPAEPDEDDPEAGGDIQVVYDDALVKVWVRRMAVEDGEGTPLSIGNIFARALGINASNISAVAAAQAFPAGTATCPLPWALIDRWYIQSDTPNRLSTQYGDDQPPFDPAIDYYEPGGADLPYEPYGPTGWGLEDKGTIFRIKPGSPPDAPLPGWYYPVVVGTGPGGDEYREAIASCDRSSTLEIGDEILVEPGAKIGPTAQGVEELVASDPSAYWDTTDNCLKHGEDVRPDGTVVTRDSEGCTTNGSPRLRPLVGLSPLEAPTNPGRDERVIVRHFASVFVICAGGDDPPVDGFCGPAQQENVWLRYERITGEAGGDLPPDPNSLIQYVRLVQ